MSKQPSLGYNTEPEDTLQQMLEGAARLLFWGGLLATVLAAGFLVWTFFMFGGGSSPTASPVTAQSNIAIFHKVLLAGLVSVGVGSTYLFWGEETLCAFQLLGSLLFFFAPFLIRLASGVGERTVGPVAEQALATLQGGGLAFGLLAVCVLIADLGTRYRVRALQGSRADLLKYGKGVKEERDIQNVFLGKCWQLPFCRKFVRERCPIYHAKRTCWRERVGCMCEEEVIAQAMANRPIPRDVVAASRLIPVNNKLSLSAKMQRCKQCVIYNEHQKHKYRLAVPCVLAFYGLIVVVAYSPLLNAMNGVINWIDRFVGMATYRAPSPTQATTVDVAPIYFQVVLLLCFTVIALTYTLRVVEYLIFKAKV